MVGLSTLDFQQFPYVPLLSARVAEVQGYRELQTSDKRRLLPTFRIERYGNGIDLNVSIRRVVIAAEGRPFILDLDRTPGRPSVSRSKPEYAEQVHKAATYNSYLTNLSAPANGFANWRAMCLSAPNAIPCALLCGPTAEFERQVREMHAQVGKVAVRVRPADPNVDLLFDFFSGFGAARDILVIVDLEDVSGRANAAARDFEVVRNSIRKRLSRGFFQNLNIVCAGTSFPRNFSAGYQRLSIDEVSVFEAVGGHSTALYGDYGSVAAGERAPSGARWVARVDGPMDTEWCQYRATEPGVSRDYVTCAQKLILAGDWKSVPGLWGSDAITAARSGSIKGMGTPQKWIAVRVNIHLYRQLRRTSRAGTAERIPSKGAA